MTNADLRERLAAIIDELDKDRGDGRKAAAVFVVVEGDHMRVMALTDTPWIAIEVLQATLEYMRKVDPSAMHRVRPA